MGWNVATEELSNQKLIRLREALVAAGVKRGERNKTVASATDYAEGSVRQLLSGSTPLTDRFVKAVCYRFGIRLKWIEDGEEPMFIRSGEQPYPGGGYNDQAPEIAGIDLQGVIAQANSRHSTRITVGNLIGAATRPIAGADLPEIKIKDMAHNIAGKPYAPNIAGPSVTDVQKIAGGPYAIAGNSVSIHDIVDKIKLYFIDCGEEEYLGVLAASAFLGVISLPDHEMIDFVYQLRKLNEGDSDKVATLAADERFELLGVKPTTRIKLERIPVEPDEDKTHK